MSQFPHSFEAHYELLLHKTLELIDDAVLVFDDQRIIIYTNPAATAVFGKGAEQLVGKEVGRLLPEDRRHAFESAITSLEDSTNHSMTLQGAHEFIGLRADQHTFYAHGKLAKLHQGELSYMLVLQDITWKKALEEELEKVLLHLREIESKVEYRLEHPRINESFPR